MSSRLLPTRRTALIVLLCIALLLALAALVFAYNAPEVCAPLLTAAPSTCFVNDRLRVAAVGVGVIGVVTVLAAVGIGKTSLSSVKLTAIASALSLLVSAATIAFLIR